MLMRAILLKHLISLFKSYNIYFLEKKEETLTEKIKRSPDERHTQSHGSLIDMLRQSYISFSI